MGWSLIASEENKGTSTSPAVTIDCTGASYIFGICMNRFYNPSGAQYAGVGMTQLGGIASGVNQRLYMFGLPAPSQGSNSLTVQGMSSSVEWVLMAVAFTGLKQTTTPTGVTTGAVTEQSSWSPSGVSSAVGELLISGIGLSNGEPPTWNPSGGTITGSWTLTENDIVGEYRGETAYALSAAATNGMTWSGAGGIDYAGVFVSFPIAVGGTQVILFASEIQKFYNNLKKGHIPPDQLINRYRQLLGKEKRNALAFA